MHALRPVVLQIRWSADGPERLHLPGSGAKVCPSIGLSIAGGAPVEGRCHWMDADPLMLPSYPTDDCMLAVSRNNW